MDKDIDIISITINGESNFSLLRRNFSLTPSEARQVSEGKMAIRQSKNSLIFLVFLNMPEMSGIKIELKSLKRLVYGRLLPICIGCSRCKQ